MNTTAAIALHYTRLGNGPPLLILHGLFGSSRNWQAIAKKLAPCYTVISADLRHHGESPHQDPLDYSTMASDIAALLDNLGFERCNLIGHSMGGKTAMTFAATWPRRVDRLIVIDIAPLAYPDEHSELIDALLAVPLGTIKTRGAAEQCLREVIPDRDVRLFLLQNLRFAGGAHWRVDLAAIRRAMPALVGAIPIALDAPTPLAISVIRGARSARVDKCGLAALRSLFESVHVETIPAAGHWPHAEAPVAFEAALQRLLTSHK